MKHPWEPIGALHPDPGVLTALQEHAARRLRMRAAERGAFVEMHNERQRDPRVDEGDEAEAPQL